MLDDDFYDSEEWQMERESVLEGWDGLCERCGEPTDSPHVLHPYLEVLCPDCHADHHGNDEIADYRRTYPKCRTCGKECSWGKQDDKWVLMDSYKKKHICKHEKEEVKEISKSIKTAMMKKKPIQGELF
jgi:hypothetical protein